ncbi:MAG TPA: membrane protein insertion efficiency factor YidD [Terriglobales bacterium]
MTFSQQLALALLRGYKWAISPLFPPSCRYVPTCSEYAMDAVVVHGVFRGSILAAWRLLRCHPFAKGGVDPVRIDKNSHAPAHAARASSH